MGDAQFTKSREGFHYIDAEDDPPASCNVDYERDCSAEEGCIVSAIANYTQRVQEPSVLPAQEVNYALRWIVHFIGDIAQPLHTEAIAVGGNTINVTFDGEAWNLHALWDTAIPNKIRDVDNVSLADAQAWASDLVEEIESGEYKACAQTWLQGDDITDAKRSALAWAWDTNLYVCSSVFPDTIEAVSESDLGGEYFEQAAETVQLQIAKGGYRLAHWLDQLAAAAQQGNSTATYKRSGAVDLSGRDLLPAPQEMSMAKLARRAFGSQCDHA